MNRLQLVHNNKKKKKKKEDTISIPVNMFFQESHWALVEDTNKK
jgi:hypothetical protein